MYIHTHIYIYIYIYIYLILFFPIHSRACGEANKVCHVRTAEFVIYAMYRIGEHLLMLHLNFIEFRLKFLFCYYWKLYVIKLWLYVIKLCYM